MKKIYSFVFSGYNAKNVLPHYQGNGKDD